MAKTVPYDLNGTCDSCGRMGAHDFMGDLYCNNCLTEDAVGTVILQPRLEGLVKVEKRVVFRMIKEIAAHNDISNDGLKAAFDTAVRHTECLPGEAQLENIRYDPVMHAALMIAVDNS